jgi:hypothetical protein
MRIATSIGVIAAAAILASSCGGSSQDSTSKTFTQSDLVGDWHYAAVFHGASVALGTASGWERGTVRVSETGTITVVSSVDSAGSHQGSVPSPWTIDSLGSFTAPAGSLTGFQGTLTTGRAFAVANGTRASDVPPGDTSLWVFQKVVPGTSFGAGDVASKTWRYHEVSTGSRQSWEHGDATSDATGLLSLSGRVSRDGPESDLVSFARMTVAGDGSVTVDTDESWSGTLSGDKSVLVATHSSNAATHEYALNVILGTGASFAQGDLAGRWRFHNVVASANGAAGWSRAVLDVDGSGEVTFFSFLSNAGVTTIPSPNAMALAHDGTLTRTAPVSPDFHGTMAASKDFLVRTDTTSTGIVYASLAFWLR